MSADADDSTSIATDLDIHSNHNDSNTLLDMSTASSNDLMAAENNPKCVEVSNEVASDISGVGNITQDANGQSNADEQNVRILMQNTIRLWNV